MQTGADLRVALIGCGVVGQKRARSLDGCQLVACADVVKERAAALARAVPGSESVADWRRVLDREDVDVVVVSTPHHMLAEITLAAVCAGKHVLVEKPAARRAVELDPVTAAARDCGVTVRVGFNHRYHPALRRAKEIYESGGIGDLMFIRGRYGHGGRVGYEKEWRADPRLSG